WDGGELHIERKSSECFTLRGARLTMGLQVQEGVLRAFLDKSKGLARNSGWLARFLLAWPRSTQGNRRYSAPPAQPQLARFHERIKEILKEKPPIKDGRLTPTMLPLGSAAKLAWIELHDAVEYELGIGGQFSDVHDVASKTADNAARIAALFHLFVHGTTNPIF